MHQKRLGDMASYVNGYAFKPEQRGKVGLPIIRIQDLTGNVYDLGFYDGEYPKKVEINDGDVLISWSASLGVYEWNRGKALLNQHIFKVVFDKITVDKKFFMYAVQYKLEEIGSKTHGATMKHITKKDFDDTVIPFPTIVEQERISNILDKLRVIINGKKFQLEKLDNLIKARFVEMFGDVYKTSKYPKQKWNNIVTIKNGKDYKKVAINQGGYPVYGTGGEIARASEFLCPENTIIVGRKGTINNPLLVGEKFWNVDTAFGVTPSDKLHYLYFFWFCKMFDFSRLNKQAVLPSTTKADLLNIEMQVPPIELQNQFAAFVTQVDKSKFALSNELAMGNFYIRLIHDCIMHGCIDL